MSDPTTDPAAEAAVAETLDFLTVEPAGDGRWTGRPPTWFGDYLFGGFVIAQAIAAVTQRVREGHRLHSAHAYFLRPVTTAENVE